MEKINSFNEYLFYKNFPRSNNIRNQSPNDYERAERTEEDERKRQRLLNRVINIFKF